MNHRDSLSSFHPTVAFFYFAVVLVLSMFLTHPLCLGISLGSALAYNLVLHGKKAVGKQLFFLFPMASLAILVNAAFSHAGTTVLTYLPSGNVLTLESILYGCAAAAMLSTAILWFSCFHAVMTADKLMYLFGKGIPSLSLALSMTLRFAPRFQEQLHRISDAQRCVNRGTEHGSFLQKTKNAVSMLSVLITWALENAMETADSMKSRGYGLPGRTAFSLYCFDSRDKAVLCWLLAGGFCIFSGWASGSFIWRYYPSIKGAGLTPQAVCAYLFYLFFCLTPTALEISERARWKKLRGVGTSSGQGGDSHGKQL